VRRSVIALDRLIAVVTGAVLIVAGAAALGWRYDRIPDAPARLEINGLTDLPPMPWWPWATGGGGMLLVVLGLAWLTLHLPRRGSGQLRLTGSDERGRLTADGNAATTTAGHALALTPGVRDGSGRIVVDRGQLVAALTATLEPTADLDTVRAAAEHTCKDLQRVIGRADLHHRIELRVARTAKTPAAPRVE
jgi:hypothetical protein